jgi:DNA-binding CsgD family transcriptional regulator
MGAHVLTGELDRAAGLQTELDAVNEVTGLPMAPYGALLLAAWRGQEERARALIVQAGSEAHHRGESFGLILTGTAAAVLNNSLGRYQDAYEQATKAAQRPPVMGVEPWAVLAELTEAAVRFGRRAEAEAAYERLAETTQATRTAWGLGIEARCRALLAADDVAEVHYRTAIENLSQTRISGELARSHLLYGEWLRRANRVTEARTQLRTAYEQFDRMGMQAFAERSAGELRAAGSPVPSGAGPQAPDLLTAQEAQIARLVADGLSNAEIAARLFLSPRTVEWHLGKVFAKLQLTSRRQLRHEQLPGSG